MTLSDSLVEELLKLVLLFGKTKMLANLHTYVREPLKIKNSHPIELIGYLVTDLIKSNNTHN
jgi:hypothetical protein